MTAAQASTRSFTLQQPEGFLRHLAAGGDTIDLSGVTLTEIWSLAAIAALARKERKNPLTVVGVEANVRAFAKAVGFDELVDARRAAVQGEEGRTVRLTEVWGEEDVEPVASATAKLLAGEDPQRRSSRDALQYVVAELLRNAFQHSQDELGAVTGAQRNDRGLHQARPTYQVAVADTGRGVRKSLMEQHWDIESDEVALERALWPHYSRAFPYGRTGGAVNAGLGLFYISELVKDLEGRLLLASGSASLVIDTALPQRQRFLSVGFPGTLVAFEIPVETARDFVDLFDDVARRAKERTPRRLVQENLRFEDPPPPVQKFIVSLFLENNAEAQRLAQAELIPRLARKESVALDFVNVRLCTQSFAHALLYEALRISWATRTPIYVVNAQPVVRSALKHVEMYAQSG
ncbi:MAG: sensor histidine kinase [Myxococcales bacterium]|nr:sensor histidine kinase [Myxococcales bacterium]